MKQIGYGTMPSAYAVLCNFMSPEMATAIFYRPVNPIPGQPPRHPRFKHNREITKDTRYKILRRVHIPSRQARSLIGETLAVHARYKNAINNEETEQARAFLAELDRLNNVMMRLVTEERLRREIPYEFDKIIRKVVLALDLSASQARQFVFDTLNPKPQGGAIL